MHFIPKGSVTKLAKVDQVQRLSWPALELRQLLSYVFDVLTISTLAFGVAAIDRIW